LADGQSAPAILPTLALENRITLHLGNRIIDVRHLGRGHTAGDLVVHLPKERIVIAGDLVVWPVPLVGNPQSNIGDWATTLKKLQELQPALIVPGHGPVMHDDSYVRMLVRLFSSVKQQVDAAVARGETLEQTRKSVNLDELRKEFAGDSRVKRMLFATYVTSPAVAAAFREASAGR
jgi:glyoxylase-like metal-dependent hydrolase (beta-lactamase superfamily II)